MSSAEPLVSIVTPSFNQGRFVKETILSVLNQNYPNIEYRVVDGGSTDETLDVLKSFEGRLSYVSERDSGQADAINKGFQQAKGEIFGWLNSDDTFLPGAIRKAVRYFQAHPDIDMMYGEGYHTDAGGKVIERYSTEPFSMQRLSEICFICQPTVFFRAKVFREIGPLDVHLQYCPDYDYWMRIGKRFSIGYLSEYLANSRLHEETKTLSRRAEVHAEIIRVVKRHFRRVPSRWIEAYAHFYLMEKVLPNVVGVHRDGWADQKLSISLDRQCNHFPILLLRGWVPAQTNPLPILITVNGQKASETVINEREFVLKELIGSSESPENNLENLRLTVHSMKSFLLQKPGDATNSRQVCYRVKQISLMGPRGAELVLYSPTKAWLLQVAFPLLCLWMHLLINRRVPHKELWRDGRLLWERMRKRPIDGQGKV